MRQLVLIITKTDDLTSDYLESIFMATGVESIRINTDMDAAYYQFSFQSSGIELGWNGRKYNPETIQSVILRRPGPMIPYALTDEGHRLHAAKEWGEAMEGFFTQIEIPKWINHPACIYGASHKIDQLRRAKRIELLVPDTIVTNDRCIAEEFFVKHGEEVITKTLSVGYIERESKVDKSDGIIYTNRLDEMSAELLSSLQYSPVLFQEYIRKDVDVRVNVIDGDLSAVELIRKDTHGNQVVDIRRDNMEGVQYNPIELPSDMQSKLLNLVRSYKLRFAAIDLVRDLRGQLFFLEINPNAQWAWLDLAGVTNIAAMFVSAVRVAH